MGFYSNQGTVKINIGGEKREDIFNFKFRGWNLKLRVEVLVPG
jgi:hypothetical protein